MSDTTQQAYEAAIEKMPPEVFEERYEKYNAYLEEHLPEIIEQINLINSVQLFHFEEREDGYSEKVYHYTPDSKLMVEALQEQREKVKLEAVDLFWEGYEHLKEGIEL